MIPEERASSTARRGHLLNPWSRRATLSYHWGPLAVSDPSHGVLVQLWSIRAEEESIYLKSPATAETVLFTRANEIIECSLAFDQNGRPQVAFVEDGGAAWLWWFDPVANDQVFTELDSSTVNPRVTLDDARSVNLSNSDVILSYIRAGVLRYRRQRDRYDTEYTPTKGVGGPVISSNSLRHASMNSVLRLEWLLDEGGSQDWILPDIITSVCEQAFLPSDRVGLNLMDWTQVVRGYTIGAPYSASGILQTLSAAFFFDPYNSGGQINFVPRGRDASASILEEDMLNNNEQVEDEGARRGDSITIPRVLHLNYYDVKGGLNTDKQRSERPEGTRADGEHSIQSPVIMSADEAASNVAKTHALIAEQQKGELGFTLPDNWLSLTESDPVFVQLNNKMVRAIISRVETDDGEQRYRAIRDRQSIYTTQVQGIPAAPVTRPPSSVAGPTLVEFLDIPLLRDIHDQLGFYMAVSGILPAWPGATVEISLDGGQTYVDSQSTRTSSVIGKLATPLGDHPYAYPDDVNSCQVQILTPNALLENTDLTGMMNRRNRALVGNEVVSFSDADELSPGVWQLSNWLRGRKGTDTQSHAADERFILLSTAMFIPAELSWLNRPLTFRATTFGRPLEEATVITVPFAGQVQVERMPAYLQGRRDGSNAIISWQGVGRLGGGSNVAMGAYFQGYRLTLTDGTTTQTHDTVVNDFTGSLAAFTGPVTVSVQQRNQFTGLGPAIEITI